MVKSVVINYERAVFIGNLVNVIVFEIQNYKQTPLLYIKKGLGHLAQLARLPRKK